MGIVDGDALSNNDLKNVPYILKLIDTDLVGGEVNTSATATIIAGGTVNAGAATTGILIHASAYAEIGEGATAGFHLYIGSQGGAGTTRLNRIIEGVSTVTAPYGTQGVSILWYETDQDWAGTVIVNLTAQNSDAAAEKKSGCYSMIITGY